MREDKTHNDFFAVRGVTFFVLDENTFEIYLKYKDGRYRHVSIANVRIVFINKE